MTYLEAIVGLNLISDIGSVKLEKLLEFFDKPQNILSASFDKLVNTCGLNTKIAHKICSLKKESIDREFKLAGEHGLNIITRDDPEYPKNLKNISSLPILLYVKGKIFPEDNISVAVVGSRRASFYGLTKAQELSTELSRKGITIVSGMASGIDTYAHRAALASGGRTIAVMGSGFSNIYPPENKELSEKIASSGAVVSEFPIQTMPRRENFPRRNRIISGLSLGVLVVEAARNSGALITADFALEQNREVFALPGQIDSKNSFGTNELIKNGAGLVVSAEDILEVLGISIMQSYEEVKVPVGLRLDGLDRQESEVYSAINKECLCIDELVHKTNIDIPVISGILLKLKLKHLIKQLPGRQFVRSDNE